MRFNEIQKNENWIAVEYAATWKYGFDFMLDAAQTVLADFGADLQRVATAEVAGGDLVDITGDVMESGGNLRECESLEECGVLAVAGISRVMGCPIQIKLYNQTNLIVLDIPIGQIPDDNPIKQAISDNEHLFDHYVSSMEIKAYCADTERRTAARLTNDDED